MELTWRGSNIHDTNTFFFILTCLVLQLWWHISFYKKLPWVWFATQNNINNRKRHTNRHLQGRLAPDLTSDVVTTTRFYGESRQLTNNNKTPGSDIFCKEQFFFVLDFSYPNHRQTVVPLLDAKSSSYQVVSFLCWIPPVCVLSQVWNVVMMLSSVLRARCQWLLDPVSLDVITN